MGSNIQSHSSQILTYLCELVSLEALSCVVQAEGIVGLVDFKEHRTPGQRRLWDVSRLEVIMEADGEDVWREA